MTWGGVEAEAPSTSAKMPGAGPLGTTEADGAGEADAGGGRIGVGAGRSDV